MTIQPTRILFATEQPALLANLREALRLAGFESEPVAVRPRVALSALGPADASLIFVDVKCAAAPEKLAQAMRSSPESRLVLVGSSITPERFLVAIETGVHGVLATGLSAVETAQALTRIWQGERQFRFDCAPPLPPAPSPACADFDSDWMFGEYA